MVGLHLKGARPGHWFTVSRNLLTLREAVPPKSASPQMSKHQIKKIKDMVRKMLMITLYAEQKKKKTQIYRTVF